MASLFDDLFEDVAEPLLWEQLAETGRVTLQAAGSRAAVAVTAIVNTRDASKQAAGDDLELLEKITISTDTANGGFAAPAVNMAVTIDGQPFVVTAIGRKVGKLIDLHVAAKPKRHKTPTLQR